MLSLFLLWQHQSSISSSTHKVGCHLYGNSGWTMKLPLILPCAYSACCYSFSVKPSRRVSRLTLQNLSAQTSTRIRCRPWCCGGMPTFVPLCISDYRLSPFTGSRPVCKRHGLNNKLSNLPAPLSFLLLFYCRQSYFLVIRRHSHSTNYLYLSSCFLSVSLMRHNGCGSELCVRWRCVDGWQVMTVPQQLCASVDIVT